MRSASAHATVHAVQRVHCTGLSINCLYMYVEFENSCCQVQVKGKGTRGKEKESVFSEEFSFPMEGGEEVTWEDEEVMALAEKSKVSASVCE